MKLMVRIQPWPRGEPARSRESLEAASAEIRRLREEGVVERAWTIIGGGSVLILDVASVRDLAFQLRLHPLIRRSRVTIEPVEDAATFLRWWARYREEAARSGVDAPLAVPATSGGKASVGAE